MSANIENMTMQEIFDNVDCKVYRVFYVKHQPDEIVGVLKEEAEYFENVWEDDEKIRYYREAEQEDLEDEEYTIHYHMTKKQYEKQILDELDVE